MQDKKSELTDENQPQNRQARLQERLNELNAFGEKEMAAIMETIERAKAAFKKDAPTKKNQN